VSVAPENAVGTDPVLVEQEPSPEVRRLLLERKNDPDWLDAKGAEGGSALGDPASVHSWLPCRDIGSASACLSLHRIVKTIFLKKQLHVGQIK
jgi:hypothetical protein